MERLHGVPHDVPLQAVEQSVKKLSNSLFVLHEPHPPDATNIDIVFFHGLQRKGTLDAYLSTWTKMDSQEEVWPQLWIPKQHPQARIISVSYDSCIEQSHNEGRMDLFLIGESVMLEIAMARKDSVRPVILVGHSFGGIVIKKVCVHASKKKEYRQGGKHMISFLDSIRGIFFYDTPHRGMNWEESPAEKEGPLLRLLPLLNTQSARLHEDFEKLWKEKRREQQPLIYGLRGSIECPNSTPLNANIPEGSSRFGDYYMVIKSDHFSICRPTDTDDTKFLHLMDLIEAVEVKIKKERERLFETVPKTIVGVDALVKDVEKHLRDRSVGFYGMVGIGKTTMAKLVFNKLVTKFEYVCFAEVGILDSTSRRREVIEKEIWRNLRHHGNPVPDASYSVVQGKKLLLVLDDIVADDEIYFLEDLAAVVDCKKSGSRFIVTSRDARKLKKLTGVDVYFCAVPPLPYAAARKLFENCAFSHLREGDKTARQYEPFVDDIVRACDGLPLSLKVMGRYLRRIDSIGVWQDVPKMMRYWVTHRIWECVWKELQKSYEALEQAEQKIFLDVATFFIHHDCRFTREEADQAWSSMYRCAKIHVQTLEDQSLLEKENANCMRFKMHEHPRRMGENFARVLGRICEQPPHAHNSSDPDRCPCHNDGICEGGRKLESTVAQRVKVVRGPAEKHLSAVLCRHCMMQEVFKQLKTICYLQLDVQISESCSQCNSGRQISLPTSLVMLALSGCTRNLTLLNEKMTVLKVIKVLDENTGTSRTLDPHRGVIQVDSGPLLEVA